MIEVLKDPSFLGALIGAIITGGIAIIVFMVGNKDTDNKSELLIKNYVYIIKEVHEKSKMDLDMFLKAGKAEGELADNYNELIVKLITRGKMLDLIDINRMIKETEKAFSLIEYIILYKEAVELIGNSHGVYGNLFFKHQKQENNKSSVEWLEYYINNMENILSSIK
ncbi:hypothetical protein [Bacillus sp. RS11]|uniref:hypothetical protein n=1 Tax=Lysinibacillus sp. RS11 TaxID=3242682 RepID=UPI0035C66DEF